MKALAGIAALLVLAGCGSTGDDAKPVTVPQQVTTASDPRIGELQVTLNELLDRMEVMNARLQKLESGAAPAPVAETHHAAPAAERPTAAAHPPEPTPAAAARGAMTPLQAAEIGDRYREALTLFGKGRLDDSRAEFQSVFDADPSGDLADNALYWIGETYFVSGKYTEAMKFYRRILGDFADQNKAPDAALKIGLAYVKLGDLGLARRAFEDVISKYPYSTPAATAKQELTRIKY